MNGITGKVSRKLRWYAWLWAGMSLWVSGGCDLQKTPEASVETPLASIHKVVVLGFRAALSPGQKPEVVRDTLSGAVYEAGPVPRYVARMMTDVLFKKLMDGKRYELIPPGQAQGAVSSIIRSDEKIGMDPVAMLQEVGKVFGADAVLAGTLYRWREREGTDYAVNRPASLAFDLHLVSVADGAILWRGRFDKTQQPLTDNVLDVGTFIKGGGRWMTAEKMAILGLEELLAKMPAGDSQE
jgi:hypothetical protein